MYIHTDGLIIKEQNIGEKDKLITVLTKSEGLIRVFARGVKNLRNRSTFAIQLFCYADFMFYKSGEKYILNEATIKNLFWDLRKDIQKLALASYFCELTLSLTAQSPESQNILRLILNSLHYLQTQKIDQNLLKPIFEIKLLCFSGYMPDLTCCKNCFCYDASQFYWVLEQGSIFCRKCFKNQSKNGFLLHRGAFTALRHIIFSDLKKTFLFKISQKSQNELFLAAEQYILYCLERNLQTLSFYKNINFTGQKTVLALD